ncbi:glycosyltransferase family 2 protein [Dinghuibacter silviterrae]|uniref:Glycosyl transferase family 2 n=1 Tax=Dinghuibacter silviterrae TaxID=1539049 RepID=A0A4R8DGI5_9BACT|nr:glycosyltransferase family 2 protein [Dinghuibacter silviterrae]TDW96605.1 glycosyl transferase family 2 [Dinghuibacter silviterrae]
MLQHKKIVVVLPAYNAARTLERTYRDIPFDIVDEVILVDDASKDETLAVARRLGIRHIIEHDCNKGYGGNQKTCYQKALALEADIVIMLHPDYQYTPRLIPAMASLIAQGVYPVVLGSRILGRGAIKGGMPRYKYFFNRVLTLVQNILMGQKLSEYHTGYRAFSARVLAGIDFKRNSDGFVFDNELLAQICMQGHEIAEVTCPTAYFPDASSIHFRASVVYGLGVLRVALSYRLHKWGLRQSTLYGEGERQWLPMVSTSYR